MSINFLIKKRGKANSQAEIFYTRVDEFWRKEDKYRYLDSNQHYRNIKWKSITPSQRYTWLTEGLRAEFETFIPMGTKEAKAAKGEAVDVIFKGYSLGVSTNRDAWVYNFNRNALAENMSGMINAYNEQVFKWEHRGDRDTNVDDFVLSDEAKIKWSSGLKQKLERQQIAEFADAKNSTVPLSTVYEVESLL